MAEFLLPHRWNWNCKIISLSSFRTNAYADIWNVFGVMCNILLSSVIAYSRKLNSNIRNSHFWLPHLQMAIHFFFLQLTVIHLLSLFCYFSRNICSFHFMPDRNTFSSAYVNLLTPLNFADCTRTGISMWYDCKPKLTDALSQWLHNFIPVGRIKICSRITKIYDIKNILTNKKSERES